MTSPIKILSADEPWVEYRLEDGTTLRFRFTACNFRKTGKTLDGGDPEYSFSHNTMCEVIAVPAEVVQLRALPDKPSEYAAPETDCA